MARDREAALRHLEAALTGGYSIREIANDAEPTLEPTVPKKVKTPFDRLKARHDLESQSPELFLKRLAATTKAERERREQYLSVLRQGSQAWNSWRASDAPGPIGLRGIHLADWGGGLAGADFSRCDLTDADLRWTDFAGANFRDATLHSADLTESTFDNADFTGAAFNGTIIGATNLGSAKGLDATRHGGPSIVGVQTLFLSRGELPESFLVGAGVPRSMIDYLPSLIGAVNPVQFNSCFISYSSVDEEFAKRLHARMRQAGLRVWFAPEDIKGGEKVLEQVDRAIHIHDKLLLVLSDASMRSGWVTTELRRARNVELGEGRRKLFPIRLIAYEAIQQWKSFDADRGVDVAEEVREYFIPDFSQWKDHDQFETSFERLVRDLSIGA